MNDLSVKCSTRQDEEGKIIWSVVSIVIIGSGVTPALHIWPSLKIISTFNQENIFSSVYLCKLFAVGCCCVVSPVVAVVVHWSEVVVASPAVVVGSVAGDSCIVVVSWCCSVVVNIVVVVGSYVAGVSPLTVWNLENKIEDALKASASSPEWELYKPATDFWQVMWPW